MPASKATSTPDRPSVRYRFVGGKGGVGKTTCAAAMAVDSARSGLSTLVISTDPAPSLGDALGQRLGPAPCAVRGIARLHAVEIDAAASLGRWLDARRATLEAIVLRGTWLDRGDVEELLRLSLPGIDEVAALFEIAELGARAAYDRVIVDTAPTGHLLRMLGMPVTLAGLARVLDHMQDKHRVMVGALRGRWQADVADALIADVDALASDIQALLRDAGRSALAWVTLPEPMSIAETLDGLAGLRTLGMHIDRVIVNRVTTPPPERCSWCLRRRHLEAAVIRTFERRRELRGVVLQRLPAAAAEPRGIAALAAIGATLARRIEPARVARATPARAPQLAAIDVDGRAVVDDDIAPPGTRLVLFGGKGGVGKTTCATAAAIRLARSRQGRVLLISTDPAHSLGDAIGYAVADDARTIRGGPQNLMVRELDAARAYARVHDRVIRAIDRLFRRESAGGGIDVSHDRRVMLDLLDLAPPGVDELVAIVDVTDALFADAGRPQYDLVVMDTAPSGHALRLIEMPSLVHEWVKALMAVLLKYQSVVGLGDLGAVLLRLSQGLGRLRALMADPARARFIAVTRAAMLPRAETMRLLSRLDGAGISAPAVIVNAAGAGTCTRCRADRVREGREIAALRRGLRQGPTLRQLIVTPARLPSPHGLAGLSQWWEEGRTTSEPAARRARAPRRGGRGDRPSRAKRA
jgi:arsenite/tail-anchored protein-transporting ATPase